MGAVACERDSGPPRSALLMGTSRRLSLIRLTLTTQHPLPTPANYNPLPAPTGGDVAPSMASQPPTHSHPALCMLSSHIALAEAPLHLARSPGGRLGDAVTFVEELCIETEPKSSFMFPVSFLQKLLLCFLFSSLF